MKDTSSKVSDNRLKKEKIVEDLLQKTEKAKGIVFTNYQGLTHQQIENLKKALKSTDAEMIVAKNTLLLRTLEKAESGKGKGESNDLTLNASSLTLNNPTAVLFLYNDIIEPLKHLAKTIKEFKLPTIKFGILEGKILTDREIIRVSTLAPLPVLRAQLLGNMKGPISGLHRALSWNINKLVFTLKAIESNKA